MGSIIESLKSHQIRIDASKLSVFRDAITAVCRKLNAPSNILDTVLTKIETDNSIDAMKAEWEIDDSDIKRLCKQHRLTTEQLCKIYNGNATHIRNGKRYDVALSSDNSCLLYARQIGNSIKYYPIKDNRFEFN